MVNLIQDVPINKNASSDFVFVLYLNHNLTMLSVVRGRTLLAPRLRHITTAFPIGRNLPATFSFVRSRNECCVKHLKTSNH